MDILKKYKREADVAMFWNRPESEIVYSEGKHHNVENFARRCKVKCKTDEFFNDIFAKCEMNKLIPLFAGLNSFSENDFKTIVKAEIPSANREYLQEKWEQFRLSPILYTYTRSPISQGVAILRQILICGGLSGKQL